MEQYSHVCATRITFDASYANWVDKLSQTSPCQMETILEALEESEGSVVEAQEYHCESVYHTPISSEFDIGDIPHFLNFASDIDPRANDPPTRDASSLREELSSLRGELEEAKRENQDLNAELAECYDYGRSLHELEIRYQRLLEDVTESNKARRVLMQNMASITVRTLLTDFLTAANPRELRMIYAARNIHK